MSVCLSDRRQPYQFSETIKANAIKFEMVTASVTRMNHVLIY